MFKKKNKINKIQLSQDIHVHVQVIPCTSLLPRLSSDHSWTHPYCLNINMQNFDSRRRFLCEINEYMYEYMFNTPLENHKNILTERGFVQKPIVDTG